MSLQVWLPLTKDLKNYGLNNLTFTVTGATYQNTGGKLGGCYYFDGVDDRIWAHGFSMSNQTMSAACWVKMPEGSSTTAYIFSVNTTGGGSTNQIGVYTQGTTIILCSGGSEPSSGVSIATNQWVHIVFTTDGNNKKLYINGVVQAILTEGTTAQSGYNITLGARSSAEAGGGSGVNFVWKGYINDFRLYDHALSPLEVKHLAQGLVLHYPLSDASNDAKRNLAPASYWAGTKTITLSANTNNYRFINSPTVDVNTNTTYFWTVDIRVVSGGENLTLVAIDTNCTGGSYSGNDSAHTVVTIQNPNLTELKAGKWQTVYCITTVKSDATNPKIFHSIFGKSSTSVNAVIEWRNLMLVESNNIVPFRAWHSDIVYDTSGFCNNGTINGSLTVSSDTPKYNISTYVNSSSSINHSRCLSNDNQEWTCCAWVKLDGSTSYQQLNNFNNCNMVVYGTTPILYLNGGSDDYYMYGSQVIPVNEWTHIAFVFKNSTGLRNIYINGILKNNYGPNKTSTPSGIPDSVTLFGQNFAGYVSDYREYATALSADDVMALYKNAGYVDSDGNVYAYEITE